MKCGGIWIQRHFEEGRGAALKAEREGNKKNPHNHQISGACPFHNRYVVVHYSWRAVDPEACASRTGIQARVVYLAPLETFSCW